MDSIAGSCIPAYTCFMLILFYSVLSACFTAYPEPLQCSRSSSMLSQQPHISTVTNTSVVMQIAGNKPPARHSHSTGLMQKNLLVSHPQIHQS